MKKSDVNHEENEVFDEEKCGKCEKYLYSASPKEDDGKESKQNSALECEVCARWFHIECEDVTPRKYDMIQEFNVHWYCSKCDGAAKSLHLKVIALQSENTLLRTDVNKLTTDVDRLEKTKISKEDCKKLVTESFQEEKETLKQQLKTEIKAELENLMKEDLKAESTQQQEIVNKIKDDFKAEIEDIKTEINQQTDENEEEPAVWNTVGGRREQRKTRQVREKEMSEYWEERDRIEKRKHNLIVTNLKEPADTNEDASKLKTLIRHRLKVTEDIIITDTTRLGNRTTDKHRMLRFTLQNLKMKKIILSKATTLRQLNDDDDFYNVYIQPDLTPNQVIASKNLKKDLMKMREDNQEKRYKIIKGKVTEINERGEIII